MPAAAAAAHAPLVGDAAHDPGVLRAVGLGWTGAWRWMDALVAAPFMALPIGTRTTRAALAGAVLAAIAGFVAHHVASVALAPRGERETRGAPWLRAAIACVSALTIALGATWQIESTAGGTIAGALLAVLPLVLLVGEDAKPRVDRLPIAALAAGAAIAYEPLAGACAIVSCAALLTAALRTRPSGDVLRASVGVALFAAATIAIAAARRRATGDLAGPATPLGAWLGERGASAPRTALAFVQGELGWPLAALGLGGLVVAIGQGRARPLAAALAALGATGLASVALGAPAGPTRFGAPALAAVFAIVSLAAIAMYAIVGVVARAKVPLAGASATMVVVLELTFPVHVLDDAMARSLGEARGASATWDDVALGPVPPGSVLLVRDRAVMTHLLAARAEGELRGDLAIVPTFDLSGPIARAELAKEPVLASMFRDLALSSEPEEFSLSQIAATRPLALAFEPAWPRALARQMVPAGLFLRFETEPRGLSDRRRALDKFVGDRDRLARLVAQPPVASDPELVHLTTTLLRARALALVATNDRELVARGVEDVRMFDADDRVAVTIIRRVASTKGTIDVRDIAP